jgi:hypothetical protein
MQCYSWCFAIAWTKHSHETASEEFDKLCFEFGIELDEDVSVAYLKDFLISRLSTMRGLRLRKRLRPRSSRAYLLDARYVFLLVTETVLTSIPSN